MTAYQRPYLYPKQRDAIFTSKRWSVCEASTKSGKTVASIAWILEGAFGDTAGDHSWWVAPVADQARIAFARIKQHLTPGSFHARESPVPTITLINGADVSFRSGDNPDSLYGEDVKRAVMDEASRTRDDSWYAVRSTLTATNGRAVIIGNVKGKKNWFYEFARRIEAGQEPNGIFSRITWKDAVEAGVLDLDEIEDAKRNLPEKVFKELYEAVASDDGGNPFGEDHIYACVGSLSNQPPVAFGIDLAKRQDYLVLVGLDEYGRVSVFKRWNNVPWRESIRRIHEIVGEDTPALVDSTGIGDPVLEELQAGRGNFSGYNFTLASKQRLMEGLAVSIQGHEIQYPDGVIKSELLNFEYEITRTGVRYTAPEGYNDDCVCALALAREQWTTTAPGVNVMKFYAQRIVESQRDDEGEEEPVGFGQTFDVNRAARTRSPRPSNEVVDNELTELYRSTLNQHQKLQNRCLGCGAPIHDQTRISDGISEWHQQCAPWAI